jgi:hypothetical protein
MCCLGGRCAVMTFDDARGSDVVFCEAALADKQSAVVKCPRTLHQAQQRSLYVTMQPLGPN